MELPAILEVHKIKTSFAIIALLAITACSPQAITVTPTATPFPTATRTATSPSSTETATPTLTPTPTLTAEVQSLVDKRGLTQTTNTETGQRQLTAEDGKVWFVEQDNGEWEQRLFELSGTENRFVYASGPRKDKVVPLEVKVDVSPEFDGIDIFGVVTQEPWLDAEGNWRFKIIVAPVGWQETGGLPEIEMAMGGPPSKIGVTKVKDFVLLFTFSPTPHVSPENFAKMLHVGDQVFFQLAVHMRALPGDIEWGISWGDYLYQLVVDHSAESDPIIDALLEGKMPPAGSLWGLVYAKIGSAD